MYTATPLREQPRAACAAVRPRGVHRLYRSGKVLDVNGQQTFEMPSSDGRTTWTVTFEPQPHVNSWQIAFRVTARLVAGGRRHRADFVIDSDEDQLWIEQRLLSADEAERADCYQRAAVRYCRRHLDEIVAQKQFQHRLEEKDLALALTVDPSDTMQAIEHEIDDVLDLLPGAISELQERRNQGVDFRLRYLPVPTVWTKHEPNLRRMRDSDDLIAKAYNEAAEFYEIYKRHLGRLLQPIQADDVTADFVRANVLGHHAIRAVFTAQQSAHTPATLGRPASTNGGWPAHRAVHLNRITVENLRCFARVDVPLTQPEDISKGQWLVLLGGNGMGKTTILRALALALLPEDTARNHVYELSGRAGLVRHATGSQQIHRRIAGRVARIHAQDLNVAHVAVSTAYGTATVNIFSDIPREALKTLVPPPLKPLVLGYGCRRGSALGDIRRESNTDYLLGTATLFDEDARVIHADTWLRDIRDQNRELFETVCSILSGLLLGVERISVEAGGITWAEGPAIGRVPLAGLSDGYLTTLGWLVDVLARWMDYARNHDIILGADFPKRMPCVVLIDEIDLHLHPRWQTEVIAKLRNTFPMTTFVATTHNPLTLHGTQPGEVHVIRASEDGNLEIVQRDLPPGVSTDELLTGDWFGLTSTLDAETQRLLQEHFVLLQQGRPEGDPERVRLEETLRQRLGHFAATRADQLAQEIVAEQLDSVDQPVTEEDRARVRALYEQRMREAAQAAGPGQQGNEP